MKRIMILLLECIFVLGLFSCNVSIEDDDTPDEENVQIILNNSENASFAAVEVGQKNSLRLSNNASAVWTVSGTASATLSASSGTLVYLTARTAGSVTVTAATENGRKYTRELRITAKDTAPNEDNEPNVSFINRSAYRVSVCRDGLTNEIAVVGAGGTKSVYVSPGRGEITFHFRYSYCVIDDADSGTVWMAAADSSVYTYAVDSVDVASGVVPIQIPAPKNPTFRDSYLVVENISEQPVSLYNKNTQHKLYNQEKYYIQPQYSGVYSIQPDAPFEGFSLKSSSAESPVSPFYAESGVVYKCEFDGSGAAAVAAEYVRQRELYTVTFEANGGTEISPLETSLLNEPSMPAPEKQGYQFAGWYTDSGFQQPVEYPYAVNADTLLYAKWIENGDTAYTVRHYQQSADFESYTLTKTEPRTGTTGALTAAAVLSYKGFTARPFEQKPIAADGTTVVEIYYDRSEYTVNHYQQNTDCQTYTLIKTELLTRTLDAPTAAKADVYEGFTARPFGQKPIAENGKTVINIYYDRNEYTVTFDSNNGTGDTATQIFYYGVPQKLNENIFPYPGYTFIGWGLSETGDVVYANQAELCGEYTSAVMLYAKWFYGIIATVDTVGNIDLTGITGEYPIKVVGNISQNTLQTLADKMKISHASINLDLSEAVLTTIDSTSDNKSIFVDCPLNSVVLPEMLETIGDYGFYGCSIKSVTIPANVQTIGNWAFYRCQNLESVEIDRTETVGDYAFYDCKKLKTVVLKNIRIIGECAFWRCTSLSSVTMDSVGSIGVSAFSGCTSLSSVIMESVGSIGEFAFSGCTSLSSVIMESVGSIGRAAFSGCTGLSSIAIDAETIKCFAFSGCTTLTSVIIGKNVKSIDNSGDGCFNGCSKLTSVRFEDTENWYYQPLWSSYEYKYDFTNAAENASRLKGSSSKYIYYKK